MNDFRRLESTSLALFAKIFNMDNIALQQIIDRLPLLLWIMQFSQAKLSEDDSSKVAVTSQRVRILCNIFSFSSFQVPARATHRRSQCKCALF